MTELNAENLLKSLQEENKILKDLLLDTENELETVKKQSKAELNKTISLIKTVAPCLINPGLNLAADKFTQFSAEYNNNYSILLADELETYLAQIEKESIKVENYNKSITKDIEEVENHCNVLNQEINNLNFSIGQLKSQKVKIYEETKKIREKIYIYQNSSNDPESILISLLSS